MDGQTDSKCNAEGIVLLYKYLLDGEKIGVDSVFFLSG